MTDDKGIWPKLGFSDGEGRVYTAILHSEAATLQSVHEQTGIERRNVYDIINKLISKGLAAYYTENGHKVYRVTHPNKILSYLDEEEKAVSEKKALLARELPSILASYESAKPQFDVRIYRGKEGVKSLFNESLDSPDHYYIGGNWGAVKYLGNEWYNNFTKKRIARKIWMHDIVTAQPKLMMDYKIEKGFYEVKVLPQEFGSPNVIFIFGNRVANLFYQENMFGFVIENGEIAKNYTNYFKYLWKRLPAQKKP